MREIKKLLNKPVKVEWKDAVHVTLGWQLLEAYLLKAEEYGNLLHYTVGILIEETDEYIVIALDVRNTRPPTLINMAQVIQKKMIVSVKELKE